MVKTELFPHIEKRNELHKKKKITNIEIFQVFFHVVCDCLQSSHHVRGTKRSVIAKS